MESSPLVPSRPDLKSILKLARAPAVLPRPRRRVVRVADTDSLYAAVASAQPATTILLAAGTYTLRSLLLARDGLALRGESGQREEVILDGAGKFGNMICLRGAKDVLIADLTMQNCKQYGIFMLGDSDVQRLRVHNVKFHNIWTRAIKGTHPFRIDDSATHLNTLERVLKVRPTGGSIRHCLFVNDRAKPYDDSFEGDYVSGIDMMWLKDWVIADNVFVGIRGRNGRGRGAIFVWVNSENVVSERNLFVHCDRAIAYGNPSGERPHMTGGIIRNNFVCGGAHRAFELEKTRQTKVYNNSLWARQARFETVSFAHGARDDRCYNNLIHGTLSCPKSMAAGRNIVGDLGGWFADPARGDLHLTDEAAEAFGAALPLAEVRDDFDGRPRPSRPDVGAHQRGAGG